MKIKLLRMVALLGVTGFALGIAGCPKTDFQRRGLRSGGVTGLLFKTQMSDADWKAKMVPILGGASQNQPVKRKQLYRIRKYVSGNSSNVEGGALPDKYLIEDSATVDDLLANFTGYAFQIGIGRSENFETVPGQIDTPSAHVRQKIKESQTLIKEVKKVLPP